MNDTDFQELLASVREAGRIKRGEQVSLGGRETRSSMKPKLEGLAPLLQVFDMPTSIAFYRDVLGFEIVETSPVRGPDDFDWVLLRLDGIDLMLNTAYEVDQRPPAPAPARVAAHRDTALFFGCRDLDSAYDDLRTQGIELEKPKVAPYGMKQLWLEDPDGYVICLQWPAE